MNDWAALAAAKQERYELQHGELDERGVVRLGNIAYAVGLALLMAGSSDARDWLQQAAAHWRASFDLGAAPDAWGRPVGALKAALLAEDEPEVASLAGWTLSLDAAEAASPIGRYAAALALLATGRTEDGAGLADSLRASDAFPADVAAALSAVAASDAEGLDAALASVVRSFEMREDYLEDVPVADTALVLAKLGRRNGLAPRLSASPVLPD